MNKLGKNRTPFLFIIDFEFTKAIILTNDEINNNKIKFSFNNFTNYKGNIKNETLFFEKNPISLSEYKNSFNKVKEEINAGNTYL
ncbi:MAG: aminodeoxychorismate synthase component I, partial [Chlorobi bacterium]|nr:aminodeoxychorismate synthase component I [Chlorobiota bacterium]